MVGTHTHEKRARNSKMFYLLLFPVIPHLLFRTGIIQNSKRMKWTNNNIKKQNKKREASDKEP